MMRHFHSHTRPTLLLLAILLLGVPPRSAEAATIDPDPAEDVALSAYQQRQAWFSRDKAHHFTFSAAGSGIVYTIGRQAGLGRWGAATAAALVVGTAGLLREALAVDDPNDLVSRTYFSRRDLVWNGVGIAVGITIPDSVIFGR